MKKRGGVIAVAVVLMSHHMAAADLPVHEVQVLAGKFAFDPPTIQVTAGEPVRLVIRSKDTVHGFSIPKLKIDVQVRKGGDPVTVEFVALAPDRSSLALYSRARYGRSDFGVNRGRVLRWLSRLQQIAGGAR